MLLQLRVEVRVAVAAMAEAELAEVVLPQVEVPEFMETVVFVNRV